MLINEMSKHPCSSWYHSMNLDCFGKTPDKKESLSWDVIKISGPSDDAVRLIAKQGVAVVPFVKMSERHKSNSCFYSDSDLKKWLNDTFLYEFFSEEERKIIKSIDVPSAEDMEKWFPEERERACTPTQFAAHNGAAVFKNHWTGSETCVYWLSDTGRRAGMSASVVLSNGKIYKSADMDTTNVCVRPVIEMVRKE